MVHTEAYSNANAQIQHEQDSTLWRQGGVTPHRVRSIGASAQIPLLVPTKELSLAPPPVWPPHTAEAVDGWVGSGTQYIVHDAIVTVKLSCRYHQYRLSRHAVCTTGNLVRVETPSREGIRW